MKDTQETTRDYRAPRGIVAWLLVYALLVLGVYGTKQLLEYQQVRAEADRILRVIPVVER